MLCGEYSYESYFKSLYGTDEGNALFISHVKNDVDKLGLEFQEYTEGMTGGYIVAIAIKSDHERSDYHFYRENGDGTWSCKWGGSKVDTGIENPQIDAYKEGYNIFWGTIILQKRRNAVNEKEKIYLHGLFDFFNINNFNTNIFESDGEKRRY